MQTEYQRAWRNGMTVPELRAFLEAHGNRCEICDRPEDPSKRGGGLFIDHDHRCCGSQDPSVPVAERPRRLCGKCSRGLLCNACNAAIGQFGDNPELLRRAIEYLTRGVLTVTPGPEHDSPPYSGGAHHRSVFTDDQVRGIRARYAAGGISQRRLAIEYGVNRSTMERLLQGRTYPGARLTK